ncbi:MAG: pseudouridine synthase [Terrimicrobiaceae bacterium]|nr:pseudouridine synthase [Terrimicrobiaceae bacterium]
MLLALHKPYAVLSQFTPESSGQRTLAECGLPGGVYPVGRLDADSEGLLLLTDEPGLNDRLLHPARGHWRRYWAQVEGEPAAPALRALAEGVAVQRRITLPARAWRIEPQPRVAPRDPPIRVRKAIPDAWIAIELREGRNRQVRRMTAAVGHPTLRLIRVRIGEFDLPDGLAVGTWRELSALERDAVFSSSSSS